MGREARIKAAARASLLGAWQPANLAPFNGGPFAVSCEITCDCGKGGRFVTTGDRYNGEWVINCEHNIDVLHFIDLPIPPGFEGRNKAIGAN